MSRLLGRHIGAGTALLGLVAATALVGAGPAHAASWNCGGDANGAYVMAVCQKGSNKVKVSFVPDGDRVTVWDEFPNGRWTIAYVKVAGNGTARFTSQGHDWQRYGNQGYDEGKSVKVKVCTSKLSGAVCSGWSDAGKT
jgi:hypothetical protein